MLLCLLLLLSLPLHAFQRAHSVLLFLPTAVGLLLRLLGQRLVPRLGEGLAKHRCRHGLLLDAFDLSLVVKVEFLIQVDLLRILLRSAAAVGRRVELSLLGRSHDLGRLPFQRFHVGLGGTSLGRLALHPGRVHAHAGGSRIARRRRDPQPRVALGLLGERLGVRLHGRLAVAHIVERLLREGRLHGALDPQHVAERVLVAVRDLEVVPLLPVLGLAPRVGELPSVAEDGARAVDLAQLLLHGGVGQRHLLRLLVRQALDGDLVDLAGARDTVVALGLFDVEHVHVELLLVRHGPRRAVVHAHRVAHEAVLLLELGVFEVELRGAVGGALGHGLLEEVARALELGAAVPRDELVEVAVPEGLDVRPVEGGDALLEDGEALLEVLVLLQERRVVEHDLRRGDPELEHAVVRGFGRLDRSQGLLEIEVEGPDLDALVHALGARHPLHHGVALARAARLHHPPPPHREAWLSRGPLHNRQRRLVRLRGTVGVALLGGHLGLPQLHLTPRAEDRREVVDGLVLHGTRLLQDLTAAVNVAVGLIELSKAQPERVGLAGRMLRVDGLDGLGEGLDHVARVVRVLVQLDALVPLGHVVRVLAQQD
mmetsp:Transcript_60825/g.167050  ORF Transcript_60825/g.167050 Transcript_60825/m.167050 type:complete len:598 (+) Transcript_60825:425-2218(+)